MMSDEAIAEYLMLLCGIPRYVACAFGVLVVWAAFNTLAIVMLVADIRRVVARLKKWWHSRFWDL